MSKLMRTLAAVGMRTTYAQLAADTGIDAKLLQSNVGALKRRGLIQRLNEGEFNTTPYFAITPKGVAYLRGERVRSHAQEPEPPPEIPEPIVVRAIRVRPALAVVWSCA